MSYDIQSNPTQTNDSYSSIKFQKPKDIDETGFVCWVEGITPKDLDRLIWGLEHRKGVPSSQNSPE